MIDKTMTRRQFNKLFMMGLLISTESLLNSSLAASNFAKSNNIVGLGSYSATSLVKAIKSKKIGATELLQYFMDRHKRIDSRINAVVATDFEGALKRAQKADEALSRGEIWGPLHGLPMTVKDNIEVVGMPTTYGSSRFSGYMPEKKCRCGSIFTGCRSNHFRQDKYPLFWKGYPEFQ